MITDAVAKELGIELNKPFKVKYKGEILNSLFMFQKGKTFLNFSTGEQSKNMLTKLIFRDAVFAGYFAPAIPEKEKWVPKEGESYWTLASLMEGVSPKIVKVEKFHPTALKYAVKDAFFGNCFRTREEARKALKEFKDFYIKNFADTVEG